MHVNTFSATFLALSAALAHATSSPTVTVTVSSTAVGEEASSSNYPPHPPSHTYPSIAAAQHAVRALRASGVAGEIVVDISKGVHPPFSVGASDSGLNANARTVYRGRGIMETTVSGGVEIPPSLFKPSATNPAMLTADITSLKLDPASFGEIVAAECIHTCSTTRAMLSFNNEEMTLARWPNFDRVN
eukprot:gene23503-12020_t